ncbi:MAG: peptidylprolyl isomerase [Clostridia bacterium]|nr:peptidylprolyl isomerase [Clostridia bacterium]
MFNKKNWVAALVMLLLVALVSGCSPQGANSSPEITEDTLAVVNGKTIPISDYTNSFALVEKSYNDLYGDSIWTQDINGRTVKQIIKDEIVNTLVIEELIKSFVEETGFVVDEEKVTQTYQDFQDAIAEEAELKTFYADHNLDEVFFKEEIRTQMIAEEFRRLVTEDVRADETKLEELYNTYSIQVNASHILVEDEATANDVLEKINAGGDFAELAAEYSKDPGSAANGGNLGYFPRGVMVPEFEDIAFSLGVGEVSGIVESQFGYHIIEVEDIQTIRDIEDGGANEEEITYYKDLIVNNLSEDAYNAKLDELFASADIQKFVEKISE